MIRLDSITWHAPAFRLENVSFSVPAEKYAVLMGKTGTGKTTLLEIICGLRPPESGSVWLGENDVTQAAPGLRGIGYVPQDGALFPTMNVRAQIGFGLRMQKRPPGEIEECVAQLSNELGISHLLTRKPPGLSGGEKQRVALARALALRPKVLLLDEPLASVDEDTQAELIALLQRTQREHAITVLHVTHSRREAEALANVRLFLRGGKVVVDSQLDNDRL
ncbi:MAG TPA: ATP-binding cassette domain-containing protein [Verrucomicrobiaceae bacterium]|jgi:ABC-type sugar transport system ATPase subunit